MNIKKLVVGSMFSMLLGSEMAAADWGDVYYCQMTNQNQILFTGETLPTLDPVTGETLKKYKLEKFKFKLDQTKNAMVFGNTGHFIDEVFKLTKACTTCAPASQEKWYANDKYSMTYFGDGKFLYTSVLPSGIKSVSADCDKF